MKEMLKAEIWSISQTNKGNILLLRPGQLNVAVPIFIGKLEMQSIVVGKEGIALPRPITHDLFIELLMHTGLNIDKVEIHELRNDNFYARITLTGKEFTAEAPLVMDCRPSDALALAVRKNCPILIDTLVVGQTGVPLDFFMEEAERAAYGGFGLRQPVPADRAPKEKYRDLLKQLNRAVAEEEYERAAEIRDMLILMEKDADK